MKTKLMSVVLALFAFGFVANNLSAQATETKPYYPLIPVKGEKQWDVKVEFIWGTAIYQVLRLGDEIELDGVLYRKLTYVMDGQYYNTGLRGAIREEDKKVYVRWWQPGLQYFMEEKLYYDFNLEVGDSFDVGYDEPYYIQAVAIEEVEMEDGSLRNKYVFNDGWNEPEVWVEGIGSLYGVDLRYEPDLMSSSFSYLQCYFEEESLVWTDGTCWDDVDEVAAEEKTCLFPNPANATLTITGKDLKQIEIVNMLGQCVVMQQANGTQTEIDICDLPAGIYFVGITDENGNRCVQKVVKG